MRNSKAFTMIEIIIVIVVLGIVAAIAFTGFRLLTDRSDAIQAETTLEEVTTAQRSFANSFGSYTADSDDLLDLSRDINIVDGFTPSMDTSTASLAVGKDLNGTEFFSVAVQVEDGTCFTFAAASPLVGFQTDESLVDAEGIKEQHTGTCTGESAFPKEANLPLGPNGEQNYITVSEIESKRR